MLSVDSPQGKSTQIEVFVSNIQVCLENSITCETLFDLGVTRVHDKDKTAMTKLVSHDSQASRRDATNSKCCHIRQQTMQNSSRLGRHLKG